MTPEPTNSDEKQPELYRTDEPVTCKDRTNTRFCSKSCRNACWNRERRLLDRQDALALESEASIERRALLKAYDDQVRGSYGRVHIWGPAHAHR